MRHPVRTAAVAAIFALVAVTASAQTLSVPFPEKYKAKGELSVGVRCDYPPMGFMDTAGKHAGLEVEMARELAKLAFGDESKAKLTCVTSTNRIPYLTTGRVDVLLAALGYNPERAKQIDFSQPYSRAVGRLLVRKDSGIKTVNDLAGKIALFNTGTPYIQWFRDCAPKVERVEFETTAQALSALIQKRGAAYAESEKTLISIATHNKDLTVTGETYTSYTGPGLRKDDPEFKAWLDAAVTKLIDEDMIWNSLNKLTTDPEAREGLDVIVPRKATRAEYAIKPGPLYTCPAT